MKRETTERIVGAALLALGAVLLVPAARRRLAGRVRATRDELGRLDGSEIAAAAGSAIARAAAEDGGTAALEKAKARLLGRS